MPYSVNELIQDIQSVDINQDQSLLDFTLTMWRQIDPLTRQLKKKGMVAGDDIIPMMTALLISYIDQFPEAEAKQKLAELGQKLMAIQDAIPASQNIKALIPADLQTSQNGQVAEPFDLGFSFIVNFNMAHHFLENELKEKKLIDLKADNEFKGYLEQLKGQQAFYFQEQYLYFKKIVDDPKNNIQRGNKDIFQLATEIVLKNPTPDNINRHEQLFLWGNKPKPLLKEAQVFLATPTEDHLRSITHQLNARGANEQDQSQKTISDFLKKVQTTENAEAARVLKSYIKSPLVRAKHFFRKKVFDRFLNWVQGEKESKKMAADEIPLETQNVSKTAPASVPRNAPLTNQFSTASGSQGQYGVIPQGFAQALETTVSPEVEHEFKQFHALLERAKDILKKTNVSAEKDNKGLRHRWMFQDALAIHNGKASNKAVFPLDFNMPIDVNDIGQVTAVLQIEHLQKKLTEAIEFAKTKPSQADAAQYLNAVIQGLGDGLPKDLVSDFKEKALKALQTTTPSDTVRTSQRP